MTPKTWAVVPSNGREYLYGCLDSLSGQVEGIVLVANGGFIPSVFPSGFTSVVYDDDPAMNISRWWNLGINEVARLAGGHPWNALIVNDDVVCPPHLVETLSAKIDQYVASMAYPNQHDDLEIVWTRAEPVNLHHRITGYCFMLSGASGIRMDEELVWWSSDDSADWEAREAGGAVLVPGCRVIHHRPNGALMDHPELHAQTGRDMETFERKWGRRPW